MKKKVLITGGAGFIGSHLSESLITEDYEVICVDNFLTGSEKNIESLLLKNSFKLVRQDITEPLTDNIGKIDFIFHLASPASPNHHSRISYHSLPMETMMVNTVGTKNVLEYAEKTGASFLFASSSEVYGDPLVHPQSEKYRGNTSTTGPRSIYDESKRFGETLTAFYHRDRNIDSRIVRIFNTYGPRMQKEDKRMVVNFILQALDNKPITIYGDGLQTRSLCFISDLVDGLKRFMFTEGLGGEVINVGNSEEHSVTDYAQLIKKLTSSASEIIYSEKLPEDDPKKRKPSLEKAYHLLKWQPTTTIEQGLIETINYFKSTL